jgi:hypothetical protein
MASYNAPEALQLAQRFPMTAPDLVQQRFANLHLGQHPLTSVADLVRTLGAMQAQDFAGTLWAIGLRLPHLTEADVIQAIRERQIVRTWPMRGTLHMIASDDIRWMLKLLTPRIIAASASRQRQLELDASVLRKSRKVILKHLQGDRQLSRPNLLAKLDAAGIPTSGQRGYHILCQLSMEGTLCFAEPQGKQAAFALLDEWIPHSLELDREASLAELAKRYFTSHGPATLHDFAWWSGLTMSDARHALNLVCDQLESVQLPDRSSSCWLPTPQTVPSQPHLRLLPGFDEYLLGYKDRSLVLDPSLATKIVPGNNGMFLPTLILQKQVAGIWKRIPSKKQSMVQITPFVSPSRSARKELQNLADHLSRFWGQPVSIEITR